MVEHVPTMKDMKRTPEGPMDLMMGDCYPSGLRITLCDQELEKIGLTEDIQVGDLIHMHCMAKVVGLSSNDHETMGKRSSVDLQITHISAEDEEAENSEEEKRDEPKEYKVSSVKARQGKFYTRA